MKVLTVKELIEKLISSSAHIERLYGQILNQCSIIYDDGTTHIAMRFDDNNIYITIGEKFFEGNIDEQYAMLQLIAAFIKNEVRPNGVGKLAIPWNAAAQIYISQNIDNTPEEGNIQKQLGLSDGLSIDEYYELLIPLLIERDMIDESYDDRIDISDSEIAVTKSMVQNAESLSSQLQAC